MIAAIVAPAGARNIAKVPSTWKANLSPERDVFAPLGVTHSALPRQRQRDNVLTGTHAPGFATSEDRDHVASHVQTLACRKKIRPARRAAYLRSGRRGLVSDTRSGTTPTRFR